MTNQRKIRVYKPYFWSHHRSGWAYCVHGLHEHLHSDDGVGMFSMGVETRLVESNSDIAYRPWVGFLHLTSMCVRSSYMIDKFNKNSFWLESLKSCKGLFTLSEDAAVAVREQVNVPVLSVRHPTETDVPKFSLDRKQNRLLFIGHWLRNPQSFNDLRTNYQKTILQGTGVYVPAKEYDQLLSQNIVFLNLHASSANNTVVECIARSTPLLINRLNALEEYLGQDYPFFYSTLEEAERKLADDKLVAETHHYLEALDKSFLDVGSFVQSVAESSIYASLE